MTKEERDELVLANIYLVEQVCGAIYRELPCFINRDDLAGAGRLGLVVAAAKYDPSKGVPFSAYAQIRIRGEVIDSIRRNDWATRWQRENWACVASAARDIAQELGRIPDNEEVRARLGWSRDDWDKRLDGHKAKFGSIVGGKFHDFDGTEDRREPQESVEKSPYRRAVEGQLSRLVSGAMGSLPERSRRILKMRHWEGMTNREISEVVGVNFSRISQIRTVSYAKMRKRLERAGVGAASW